MVAPMNVAVTTSRISEIVRREGEGAGQGKIVVKDLQKSFGGPRDGVLQVIGGISFAIGEGKTVAVVGPSGCGKSTLVKILAGFERPDSGSISIDGRARNGPSPKGILISQHGSVFPWLTVRQNLVFGLTEGSDAENAALADRYIALVGLKGFENSYPRELSGGMLKRVELARALVVKPDILYMDEPFSALDALTSLKIRVELLRILERERHTVVLITHDIEEAIHLSDRILVLSPRPTTIQATFDVPLRHPRKVSSPQAQSLRDSILHELGL
jgi:ABC-type nitrate/sulfonate/bicarbonate transport system ATPase subunit